MQLCPFVIVAALALPVSQAAWAQKESDATRRTATPTLSASIAVPAGLDVQPCEIPVRPDLDVLMRIATPPPEGTAYELDRGNSYSAIAALPSGGFAAIGGFNPNPRTIDNPAAIERPRVHVLVAKAGTSRMREYELPVPPGHGLNAAFAVVPLDDDRLAVLVRGWFDAPWSIAIFDGAAFGAWRTLALPPTEWGFRAFAAGGNRIAIEGLALKTELSLPRGYRAEINVATLSVSLRRIDDDNRTTHVSTAILQNGGTLEAFSDIPFPNPPRVVVSRRNSNGAQIWRRIFTGCDGCVFPDAAYPTDQGFLYVATNQTKERERSRPGWDIAVGRYDTDGNTRSWHGFRFPDAYSTDANRPDSLVRIADMRSIGGRPVLLVDLSVGSLEWANSWLHYYWLIAIDRDAQCRLALDWAWLPDVATVRTEAALSNGGKAYFASWGIERTTKGLRGVWIGMSGP